MYRLLFIVFIISCLNILSINVHGESLTEKCLGDRITCLDTSRINESRILDDQTILFKMIDGNIYLCRLSFPCPGLKFEESFSYETSIDKLCNLDIIKVFDSTAPQLGSSCTISEFIHLKAQGTLSDIEKILMDGVLEELINEAAFSDKRNED